MIFFNLISDEIFKNIYLVWKLNPLSSRSSLCYDSLDIQVENLHEVFSLLDGEEQAAACKLRESLDQLHQSNQTSDMILFIWLIMRF